MASSRAEEPRLSRLLRLLAVLVFAGTAFFPVHGCGPGPGPKPAARPVASAVKRAPPKPEPVEVQIPIVEVVADGGRGWSESGPLGAFWAVRVWYPYVLAPLWVAALVLAFGSARLARAAGWGLLAVSVGVAAFELAYISWQFHGFLPTWLRPLEVGVAWLLVLAILFVRRPGRSALDAEATVSAHAFLSACHGLTYPGSDVRGWLRSGYEGGPIVRALLSDYLPAYWIALGALLVAAIPGYLLRPRAAPLPAAVEPVPESAPPAAVS